MVIIKNRSFIIKEVLLEVSYSTYIMSCSVEMPLSLFCHTAHVFVILPTAVLYIGELSML